MQPGRLLFQPLYGAGDAVVGWAVAEMTKVGGVAGCRLVVPSYILPSWSDFAFLSVIPEGNLCLRYSRRSEYRRETADLSTALRSNRDDKGRWSGWI